MTDDGLLAATQRIMYLLGCYPDESGQCTALHGHEISPEAAKFLAETARADYLKRAPTEVFEVVDRLTRRRAMEHVHLTANAAMDWIERQDPKWHASLRAQSVKVYRDPSEASDD